MKYANPVFFAALLVCSLGVWGCSQQKNSAAVSKNREIEERMVKLEADHQEQIANNRKYQRKVQQLEVECTDLKLQRDELRGVVKERDAVRSDLVVRTGERDQARQQLAQFKNDLQSMVGRVETALNEMNGADAQAQGATPAIPTSRTQP